MSYGGTRSCGAEPMRGVGRDGACENHYQIDASGIYGAEPMRDAGRAERRGTGRHQILWR